MSGTKKYYGRNQWKQWILECRDSGLTVSEWCNQHSLDRNRFFKWRRKFLEDGTIEYYPLRSDRTCKHSGLETDEEDREFPSVLQVNLDSLQSGNDEDNTLPGAPAQETGQLLIHSQVMIETPIQGYRIHLGTGFDQDVLKKLLEVIH